MALRVIQNKLRYLAISVVVLCVSCTDTDRASKEWRKFRLQFEIKNGVAHLQESDSGDELHSSVIRTANEALRNIRRESHLESGHGYLDITAGGYPPYLVKVERI